MRVAMPLHRNEIRWHFCAALAALAERLEKKGMEGKGRDGTRRRHRV